MERKTKVHAEPGRQELLITREFDLPLDLLFKAYAEAEIVEQWMGTKVLKLENRKHGGWQFQTTDQHGQVVFAANGVIHEFVPGKKIVRTFEMDNSPFDVQLEFLDFEALGDEMSRLTMQIVCRSASLRDQMLQLPFSYGLNMAHNRLQAVVNKLK
ncbi:MAG TPA: SRPBCC domain-containing protein [Flavisolibacter sp.]|nr:SRPBCC domain-containing protein [Flavisolibacter sp.]